jgi:hypothetical protein
VRHQLWIAAVILAVAGCSAIKIETGRTAEEQAAVSSSQASELRRNWARSFDSATETSKAALLKQHIDTTSARLVYIGRQFAREWDNGNRGRGAAIPAADFQRVIENSLAKDRPILQAWEDNLEYGWDWVRDSSRFDSRVKGLFGEMVDQYYDVSGVVLFPKGDVETYTADLDRVQDNTESLSRELAGELERYR